MIPLDQALATVAEVMAERRLPAVRRPLWEALGQILAEDIPARLDAPPFDRATMDGWAIAAGGERRTFRVAGVVHAGDAEAAAELLASPTLDRVRECAGHPCGWLFIDTSRNRSRRWCSRPRCRRPSPPAWST